MSSDNEDDIRSRSGKSMLLSFDLFEVKLLDVDVRISCLLQLSCSKLVAMDGGVWENH